MFVNNAAMYSIPAPDLVSPRTVRHMIIGGTISEHSIEIETDLKLEQRKLCKR